MTTRLVLTHSLLWATAILAAGLLQAPTVLWLLVLPGLATVAWLANLGTAVRAPERRRPC